MRKCWGTLKISSESKSKKNSARSKSKRSKRNKWETILPGKSKKRRPSKSSKRKSMKSRPRSGKKTLQTFSTTKRIKVSTSNKCISNMNQFSRSKWRTKRKTRTVRKWTLWSCFTIKPWWRLRLMLTNTSKRQKYEGVISWFHIFYSEHEFDKSRGLFVFWIGKFFRGDSKDWIFNIAFYMLVK